jgi:hypothetical protein
MSVCLLGLVAACAHGPFPLEWTGGSPPRLKPLDRSALLTERVRCQFIDERPEPRSMFGVRPAGREYHASDPLGSWVEQHFVSTLSSYGVPIVSEGETVLLRISLTRLLVTEGNTYRGEMNFRADALRPGQQEPFWRGVIQAGSNRWGSTADLGMYREVLSNTVLDAARDLMDDPGFIASMRPTASVVPPVPPPPPLATAFCPRCGAKLAEGAHFCHSCGAAVPKSAESPAAVDSPGPGR